MVGVAAAAASLYAAHSKTIIPLRVAAIVANALAMTYSLIHGTYPTVVLNALLLPLNAWRLHAMLGLIHEIDVATKGDMNVDWLLPYTRPHGFKAGDIIMERGEYAAAAFYVVSGEVEIVELNETFGKGTLLGEIVSGGYLSLLGVRANQGRLLVDTDDRPGSLPAAVISDALWRLRFGGEAVLGRSVLLNGHGPKFEHDELAAVKSLAALPEDHRTRPVQLDGDRREQENRGRAKECQADEAVLAPVERGREPDDERHDRDGQNPDHREKAGAFGGAPEKKPARRADALGERAVAGRHRPPLEIARINSSPRRSRR